MKQETRLTFEVNRIECSIDLNQQQWNKLEALDEADFLDKPLKDAGAIRIEFNGHFGMALYFWADDQATADRITQRVAKLIDTDFDQIEEEIYGQTR